MNEKKFNVRFHHPLEDRTMELALPASVRFSEILKLLYNKGFIEKKSADYGLIIGKRLCALNKSLSSYVPLDFEGVIEIELNGLLTIMS